MSLNFINKLLVHNKLWVFFSFIVIALYLSPLVMNGGVFYTPIFDNLDSNVVWYKILAESGMIFADNNAIIPNMMNGLPRSSYPGEYNIILWLYYFFSPQTAYVINEILIHIVAFFSMYIFLKNYIVKEKKYYHNVPIYAGALYFALIPYWSGAGLTIAILPLVTYSLLNIKNGIATKLDWLLLILLPLYTHFIFLYIFYIILAGIYMVWDTINNRQLNKPFFLALFLMGTAFLLSEYRLILAMFLDVGFVSHRTEFNVFFTNTLLEVYRNALIFFLDGHISHVRGLQVFYLLPIVLIGMILSLAKRRFNARESMVIWLLVILSFILEVWNTLLTNLYTLPTITIFSLYLALAKKENRAFGLLILLQLILIVIALSFEYKGFANIVNVFPILNKLNFVRLAFVEPFIFAILLVMALLIFIRKLHFSFIFISLFIFMQALTSFNYSFYQSRPTQEYASFQSYYAPNLFKKVKEKISEPMEKVRVVSYGLEPAVSLYNGFYTVDGYSVNYPLSYKHKFRNVISKYLNDKDNKEAREIYDNWGGKVYILSTPVTFKNYIKDTVVKKLNFSSKALCTLGTDYMLSSYKFEKPEIKNLTLIDKFKGNQNSWDIYLYKLECQ